MLRVSRADVLISSGFLTTLGRIACFRERACFWKTRDFLTGLEGVSGSVLRSDFLVINLEREADDFRNDFLVTIGEGVTWLWRRGSLAVSPEEVCGVVVFSRGVLIITSPVNALRRSGCCSFLVINLEGMASGSRGFLIYSVEGVACF